MKNLILSWIVVFPFSFLSCNKEDKGLDDSQIKASVQSLKKLYPGDSVVITGVWPDPPQLELIIDGSPYPFEITEKRKISFIAPEVLEKYEPYREFYIVLYSMSSDGNRKIQVPFYNSSSLRVYKRPQVGWQYQSSINHLLFDGNLSVAQDTSLWLLGSARIYRSYDGWDWVPVYGDNDYVYSYGGSFINRKTGWMHSHHYEFITYTHNYEFDQFTPDLSLFEEDRGNIIKAWPETYNSGIIAYEKGLVIRVDDFSGNPGTIQPLFQSPNQFCKLDNLSVNNKDEFVVSGGDWSPIIIFKEKEKSPVQYPIPEWVSHIQLLKNKTIYFCNKTTGNFYRVTWPFSIEKLEQKANKFHFLNEYIGYAIFDGIIYKTTDGALSWSEEFKLDKELVLFDISSLNEHVWVVLTNTVLGEDGYEVGKMIILKYTPIN